jgi:hypothetical protein
MQGGIMKYANSKIALSAMAIAVLGFSAAGPVSADSGFSATTSANPQPGVQIQTPPQSITDGSQKAAGSDKKKPVSCSDKLSGSELTTCMERQKQKSTARSGPTL